MPTLQTCCALCDTLRAPAAALTNMGQMPMQAFDATSNQNEFLLPAGYGEAELVEKRSRFVARVWPVANQDEAQARLEETRKRYYDANHHVFAYRIRGGQERCSDDGEPQGTSGPPILNVLRGANLVDACCVVTRYFGGTLLGTGGLARAYSGAARLAVDKAGIAVSKRWRIILVACPYNFLEPLRLLLARHEGIIESTEYGVDVVLEVLIPENGAEAALSEITEASAGKVEPENVDTVFRAVAVKS